MSILTNIWKFLDGKKSILSSLCIAAVGAAMGLGWINREVAEVLLSVLGGMLGISLKLAFNKAAPNV